MLRGLIDRYFIKQPLLRRAVTRMAYGSGETDILLFDVPLTVDVGLENGYLRAARRGRSMGLYRDEAAVIVNLASLVGPGTCFVDAGANIGIFSSVMARLKRLHPDVHVMAFEVDPRTFARLEKNARRNGFDAYNVGLSDREQAITFVRGAVSHVTATLDNQTSYNIKNETFQAQVRPLSSFDIPGNDIVLKIDVEGAEYEVLMGARPLFGAKRIKAVYFDGVNKYAQAASFLSSHGFRLVDGRTLQSLGNDIFSVLALRPG